MSILNQNFRIDTYLNGKLVEPKFVNDNPNLFITYPSSYTINGHITYFRNNPNKLFVLSVYENELIQNEVESLDLLQ